MGTPGGWKDWARALSWCGLLSLAPPPQLPPLSPCLLLLRLPRDVNSLKLLIKNILLSPPKVCFPMILLLEGEMGEGGQRARSEGQAFLGLFLGLLAP